jgi:hypothetical protein
MFEYHYAALFSRGLAGDLARSALPDAPVQPPREGRWFGRRRRRQPPPSPADRSQTPAPTNPSAAAVGSSGWDPCPCGQWGVCREDRHGCLALCRELFPELDRELDAWEAAHAWLYR